MSWNTTRHSGSPSARLITMSPPSDAAVKRVILGAIPVEGELAIQLISQVSVPGW
jgi:hypothetical protein